MSMSFLHRVFWPVGLAFVLVSSGAKAQSFNEERAKEAEAEAFRAVESEAWCDALHLFVFAHQSAPSLDLIWNAAQAADLAKDRKQALKLYVELLGAYPNSERESHVRDRIGALTQEVADVGRGVSCPVPAVIARFKNKSADKQSGSGGKSAAASKKSKMPTGAGSSKRPTEPAKEDERLASNVMPYATLAAGTGAVLAGAALTFVGAMPYFEFLSARDAILEAERNRSNADALHTVQSSSRENWETWGGVSVAAGSVLLGIGLITAVAGGIWSLVGDGGEALESTP